LLTAGVAERLRAKVEAVPLGEWLKEAAAAALPADAPPSTASRALCHALLIYGKANLRNAHTLFTRYAPLLRVNEDENMDTVEDADAASYMAASTLLDACGQVWSSAPYMCPALTAAACDTRVVSAAHAVRWALCSSSSSSSSAAVSTATPRWTLINSLLGDAHARAHRSGVRLAMFRGADVFDDVLLAELYEDDAVIKDAALSAATRELREEYCDAVIEAVTCAAVIASEEGQTVSNATTALSFARDWAGEHMAALHGAVLQVPHSAPAAVNELFQAISNGYEHPQLFVPQPFARDALVPPCAEP
jgi:hypothetical protein